MAKDCMILPASGVDLTIESNWADTAVTVGKNHKYLAYFQGTKGLAEYRQGRLIEAAEWARKAIGQQIIPGRHSLSGRLHGLSHDKVSNEPNGRSPRSLGQGA